MIDISLFVTCICDALYANTGKNAVALLEQLGCRVHFIEAQTCCGQPAVNSGYQQESLPAIKKLIESLEANDYPLISLAGSCTNMIKGYPDLFKNTKDEKAWYERAEKLAARTYELTQFIVQKLDYQSLQSRLDGTAVYHPSCSLFRKLGIRNEPIELLNQVTGLSLTTFANQETCCGFGGTFSVKMAEISGEMVKEKSQHIQSVEPDYLIGADLSCLMNIGGRLKREKSPIKVMHIADVLMSR